MRVLLNPEGTPVACIALSGDPALYPTALRAAETRQYGRDCDEEGNPVSYTMDVTVVFDRRGEVVEVRLPARGAEGFQKSRLARHVEPRYPDELKRAGIKGIVVLQAKVDEDGNVTEAEVRQGPAPLHPYALQAVLQWKYRPTYLYCERVPVVVTVAVPFSP